MEATLQRPPKPQAVDHRDYHGHPAISSTKLKTATTATMRTYWARYLDPERPAFAPTDAMRQGSLVDTFVTQPDKAEERYCVMPADAPRRPTEKQLTDGRDSRPGTKIHDAYMEAQDRKAWWDDFDARLDGREVISQDWWDRAERIREVLLADKLIGPRLGEALVTSQDPHLWHDDELGDWARYLPDLETESGELFDLKKARSCSPRQMISQSYALAYDVQLAHYWAGFTDRHGAPPEAAGLIAYEWEWPHDCVVLTATPELIQHGAERRIEAWNRIQDCIRLGEWPTYGPADLDLPGWLKRGERPPEGAQIDPDSIALF